MPGFIRRFSVMPSIAQILAVSGVVIVDQAPAQPVNGAAFGKVCIVGEFDDGPYNTPTDLLQSTDWATIFGGLGFTYSSGLPHQYPSALQSGGTEPWNGNAYIQANRLAFGGTALCRVNTSVGSVALTPRAFIQTTQAPPFNIAPGQTFIYTIDGGSPTTVTFAGAAATHTGTASPGFAVNPGDVLQIGLDGGSLVNVTFQAGDGSIAGVVARINATLGATVASTAAGNTELVLTSTTFGTASHVQVAAASGVLTALGLSAATYNGSGDAANLAAMTFAEFQTKVTAGTLVVKQMPTGQVRLISTTSGTGSLVIGAGTANAALGLTSGASVTAALAAATVIPAGTRCSNAGATRVVTAQTMTAAAGSTSTVVIPVRPAVDDGSYPGAAGAAISTLEDSPGGVEWTCTNPSALTAALTAAQLDSAYLAAIASCVGIGSDTTKKINGIVSARQSTAIRAALAQNAINTSSSGHYGRRGFFCPPNGSTAQQILALVVANRYEQTSLAVGGIACQIQELIDGGYSTTGAYVRHPDVMLAARWSSLPPGYNPGQLPEDPTLQWDTTTFTGLEPAAQGWDLTTYAAFKQAGVCAAQFDANGGITFEQGITTVDPNLDPSHTDISRKTLEDYISDSCSGLASVQVKRQGTALRESQLEDAFNGFLATLTEAQAGGAATVDTFKVTYTKKGQPTHVVRYDFQVDPVESDDVIIFNMSVGAGAVQVGS